MSEILKKKPDTDNQLSHFVRTDDGKYYFVDSRWSGFPMGNGYETIAVQCNKRLQVPLKNWSNPDYVETYGSEQEMAERHNKILTSLEDALAIYD